MEDSSDSEFYQNTIDRVEHIYGGITDLFGEDSMEDGLFFTRSNTLHQFSILASAFHQLNTLDFLQNSSEMTKIFLKEINTANYRTRDYENKAMNRLVKNMKKLDTYLEEIIDLQDEISDLNDCAEQQSSQITNLYYQNILDSLTFYLQEINSRILQPAGAILYDELQGSKKLISSINDKYNKSLDVTMEEIARMCEVMSWGLESPPGWNSIQNESSELTGNLEKKIGSLKAIRTFY